MNVISSRLLPFAFLLIIFTFMVSTSASAQFDGGDGTKEDPWQIATVEQLQSISDNLDAHFILTADIDASSTADWNDGLGFEPIGDMDPRFTGSLDGNGITSQASRLLEPAKITWGFLARRIRLPYKMSTCLMQRLQEKTMWADWPEV